MIKLLITDDEPEIVDGIYYILKESDLLDISIVKTYSGVEAYNYIKEHRVDIVLSDIRMPVLDGFGLKKKVLELWHDTEFIFLTGYNEFDYVYKAIKSDNVQYILKTESEQVIIETVSQVISKILDKHSNFKFIREAKPLVIKELLKKILTNNKISEKYIISQFEKLNIPLLYEREIFILIARFENHSDKYYPELYISLDEIITLFLSNKCESVSYSTGDKGVWIFQSKTLDSCYNTVKGYLESIQDTYHSNLSSTVSLFLGHKDIMIEDFYYEYKKINIVINSRFLGSKDILFLNLQREESMLNKNKDSLTKFDIMKEFDDISDSLIRGDLKKYEKSCNLFFDSMNNINISNGIVMMEIVMKFTNIFITYINKTGYELNTNEENRLLDGKMDKDKIEQFYPDLGRRICNGLRRDKVNEDRNHIFRINKYISENISSDLSLTSLADKFYFNSSYLSRRYSQLTGIKLSVYIKDTKIRRAKELLQNTNLQINEIGLAVGFDSAAYFTSFFKKYTGITPREFRC